MVYHADNEWLHGGFLGVEVFFVISGYLITLLLIARARAQRARRPPAVLVAAVPAPAAGAVRDARPARDLRRARFERGAQGAPAVTSSAALSYVQQLVPDLGRRRVHGERGVRPAAPPVVARGRGAVLPAVAAGDGGAPAPRAQPAAAGRRCGCSGIVAVITVATALVFVPGDIDSTCTPEAMPRLLAICRAVHQHQRRAVPRHVQPRRRAAARCRARDGVASGGDPARAAARRGPPARRARRSSGSALLGWLMWHVHLADPALTILTGSRFDPWLFRGGLLLTGAGDAARDHGRHPRAGAGRAGCSATRCSPGSGTRSYGLYLYHWPIYQIIRREAGLALEPWQFVLAMRDHACRSPSSATASSRCPIRQGRIGAWLRSPRRSRPSAAVLAPPARARQRSA